jgi:site-specific recombinase XerD
MPYPDDGAPQAPRFHPLLPLAELFAAFLAASVSHLGPGAERGYRQPWRMFLGWLALDTQLAPADGAATAAGAKAPVAPILGSLSKQLFVDYIAYLRHRPIAAGRGPLSPMTVAHYVRVLRTFVRWLVAEGYYAEAPFAEGGNGVEPRLAPRLLRTAQVRDIDVLLAGCDAGRPRNRIERALRDRDRLIVLLVADTGLRAEEVRHLAIGDANLANGWLLVRETKWDREGRVPVSRETIAALHLYLRKARPVLAARPADEANVDEVLFLSASGEQLTVNGLYEAMCLRYQRGGGIGRFGLNRLRQLWVTHAAEEDMHPRIR